MPKRNITSEDYRFGFNGQEREDELSGIGNSYTATFWQYDSRLGRRWNLDPVVKNHESPYATFSNNPMLFVDPHGDDTLYMHVKQIEQSKDPNAVLYQVTFSIVQNGVECIETAPMNSSGDNSLFLLNDANTNELNLLPKEEYKLINQNMASMSVDKHPKAKYQFRIAGTKQFIHNGISHTSTTGCLITMCEYFYKHYSSEEEWGTEEIITLTSGSDQPNSDGYGQSQEALEIIHSIFSQAKNNSGDRKFEFILKPRSEATVTETKDTNDDLIGPIQEDGSF